MQMPKPLSVQPVAAYSSQNSESAQTVDCSLAEEKSVWATDDIRLFPAFFPSSLFFESSGQEVFFEKK